MQITAIRNLCAAHRITFAELERATGLGNGTIAKWDGTNPGIDTVKRVADYFRVPVDRLLNEE